MYFSNPEQLHFVVQNIRKQFEKFERKMEINQNNMVHGIIIYLNIVSQHECYLKMRNECKCTNSIQTLRISIGKCA